MNLPLPVATVWQSEWNAASLKPVKIYRAKRNSCQVFVCANRAALRGRPYFVGNQIFAIVNINQEVARSPGAGSFWAIGLAEAPDPAAALEDAIDRDAAELPLGDD